MFWYLVTLDELLRIVVDGLKLAERGNLCASGCYSTAPNVWVLFAVRWLPFKSVIAVVFVVIGLSIIAITNYLRFYGHLLGGSVVTELDEEYDYIVVGASPAGSVVAARLSERPEVRVLLLEAGEEETVDPLYHVPGASGAHVGTQHSWHYNSEPQSKTLLWRNDGHPEKWITGKLLGGSSTINAMQYTRGSRYDFDSWEASGCEGWGYDKVLPYFLKSEDAQSPSIKDSEYHSTDGFLGVTQNNIYPFSDSFLDAGRELGYKVIDHNTQVQVGFSHYFESTKDGERKSPVRHLLRPAMLRDNLHVSVRSHVTKVVIEDMKAVGVDVVTNNRKRRFRAKKEVIVSAGSIGSPHILLLSGIGPALDLAKFNIPVVADLPVGRNMRNHIGLTLWTDSIDSDTSLSSTLDFMKYLFVRSGPLSRTGSGGTAFLTIDGSLDRQADVQINMMYKKVPLDIVGMVRPHIGNLSKGTGFTSVISLLHPSNQGHLTLRSHDPFDHPVIDPNYELSKADRDKLLFAIKTIEKLWIIDAFRRYNTSINANKVSFCSHVTFNTDDYWDCYIRNMMFSGLHQTSTCKMGSTSDETAVVDPKLKVRGVTGLRVMDASVMPREPSGNPSAPSIMIGEKGADMILQELDNNN